VTDPIGVGEPAGAGSRGSASTSHSNPVNASHSGLARALNRRNQPRTVAAGRPACKAARRCPHPAAARASAAPITPTSSARRSSTPAGSSTCVTPQPAQRARRGRSRHFLSPSPRITRAGACPHGRSQPSQAGHANPPVTSRRSTSPESLPTVSTGASKHHTAALPDSSAKRRPGGPRPTRTRSRCRRTRKRATPPSCPTTTITPNDATPPLHAHPERRGTPAHPLPGEQVARCGSTVTPHDSRRCRSQVHQREQRHVRASGSGVRCRSTRRYRSAECRAVCVFHWPSV
jgi:hypothetical protein